MYYYSRQASDLYDEWSCDNCPAVEAMPAGDDTAATEHVKATGHNVVIIRTCATRIVGYRAEVTASAG